MPCTVVTISRTLGAGGEEIGFAAASELGFRYADEEIIVRAAEKAGVSRGTVAAAEHTPGLIRRILESMARTPDVPEVMGYMGPTRESLPDYEGLIEGVVRETAAEGNVVIVAHAAGVPLTGMKGLLRCFITCPRDVRVGRLVREGTPEAEARKAIEESDRQRREYLRRFYDVRDEQAVHYDLVLNSDVLSIPAAAKLLVGAAKSI